MPVAGTCSGPYEDLVTVNVVLIDWSKHAGVVFVSRRQPDGEWFARRPEILHDSPAEAPDPRKFRAAVTITLRDP